jgi:hypothetical protein
MMQPPPYRNSRPGLIQAHTCASHKRMQRLAFSRSRELRGVRDPDLCTISDGYE